MFLFPKKSLVNFITIFCIIVSIILQNLYLFSSNDFFDYSQNIDEKLVSIDSKLFSPLAIIENNLKKTDENLDSGLWHKKTNIKVDLYFKNNFSESCNSGFHYLIKQNNIKLFCNSIKFLVDLRSPPVI